MRQGLFTVETQLDVGTPVEQTDARTRDLAARVRSAIERAGVEVASISSQVGVPATRSRSRATGRTPRSSSCSSHPRRSRLQAENAAREAVRAELDKMTGIGVPVIDAPALFQARIPLEAEIVGHDRAKISQAAVLLEQEVAGILGSRERAQHRAPRPPRDRDPLRPGGARALLAQARGRRRDDPQQGAGSRRDPVHGARAQDRRPHAAPRKGPDDRGDARAPPDQPGAASARCRSSAVAVDRGRGRPRRDPARRRPARRDRLRRPGGPGPARSGPRDRGARREAPHRAPRRLRSGRRPPRGTERGSRALDGQPPVRAGARDVPRLPAHGGPVRVAATPLRDHVHDSARADRRRVRDADLLRSTSR